MWKPKDLKAKVILTKKKKKVGGLYCLISRLVKATLIKTVWFWHKEKYISLEQGGGSRNRPTHNDQLILTKVHSNSIGKW